MAILKSLKGFLKNVFCFQSLGLSDERAPPPRPVQVRKHLPAKRWDLEGLRACEELVREPGTHFGIVVRTHSEAAAGKCCIIYEQ